MRRVEAGDVLSHPGSAIQPRQSGSGAICGLSGAANVSARRGPRCATLKPHRGDAVPQHEALVTFRMPRDFTLARAALDRCPPPLSVGRDVYFGKVVQCKGSVTSRPLLGTPGGLSSQGVQGEQLLLLP